MSDKGDFLIYCLQLYANSKNLSGKQLVDLSKEKGLFQYIYTCYDSLHTTGDLYIIDSVDTFLKNH